MIGAWSIPLYLAPQVVDIVETWDWNVSRSPFSDRAPNFVELAAVFLAGVGIAIYVLLVYLNVPKILSPRDMRNDPGLLAVRHSLSRGESAEGIYSDLR